MHACQSTRAATPVDSSVDCTGEECQELVAAVFLTFVDPATHDAVVASGVLLKHTAAVLAIRFDLASQQLDQGVGVPTASRIQVDVLGSQRLAQLGTARMGLVWQRVSLDHVGHCGAVTGRH